MSNMNEAIEDFTKVKPKRRIEEGKTNYDRDDDDDDDDDDWLS